MKNLFITIFFSVSLLFIFSSCGNWNDIMLLRALKPEEAREYDVKGSLYYFTVYSDPDGPINGLVVMFRGAPDLAIPLNGGIEGFTLDLSTNCTGISRIGVRYSDYGVTKQYWFRESYTFAARTNSVNYLGRFMLDNLRTYDTSFSLKISNVLQKDRVRFAESYASQTNNRPFFSVELKKDTNR